MSNIQDVAKMAGVSVATVSRVLNNSNKVTQETREYVLSIIKKLNYKPNLLGRNLRRMETKLILVLLPSIANPFYSRIVKGMEDIAHKNGYNVMLCDTDSNVDRERGYIEILRNKLSDGVIFMAPEISEEELSEIGHNYPVVQCCEFKKDAKVSHISIDNVAGAKSAIQHLIQLGHRRIGMISADNNYYSTLQREIGYKEALAEAGIEYDSSIVMNGDYSFESGIRATKRMLSTANKPTAIFCISDVMAIGAIREIKHNNMKVPDDIAIVGFDNIDFAKMYDPVLTTISQPKYSMGCKAMEMLLKQIKGECSDKMEVVIDFTLLVRESTVRSI